MNVTAGRQNDPAVPKEIERKFLVSSEAWRDHADAGWRQQQAYLAVSDRAVVRIRMDGGSQGFLTIKSAVAGLSRDEFEYLIPVADAEALVRLRHGSVVDKTRFTVPHGGRQWEVDVYAGDNAGLVVAEIELDSETELVDLPPWVGPEVTGEARYYASRLALAPFRFWPDAERSNPGPAG